MSPSWICGYVHKLAKITGWGFREIVEELPLSAGIQIIDAERVMSGENRRYDAPTESIDFDALNLIDECIAKNRRKQPA